MPRKGGSSGRIPALTSTSTSASTAPVPVAGLPAAEAPAAEAAQPEEAQAQARRPRPQQNKVRGPRSALTDFLKERGIKPRQGTGRWKRVTTNEEEEVDAGVVPTTAAGEAGGESEGEDKEAKEEQNKYTDDAQQLIQQKVSAVRANAQKRKIAQRESSPPQEDDDHDDEDGPKSGSKKQRIMPEAGSARETEEMIRKNQKAVEIKVKVNAKGLKKEEAQKKKQMKKKKKKGSDSEDSSSDDELYNTAARSRANRKREEAYASLCRLCSEQFYYNPDEVEDVPSICPLCIADGKKQPEPKAKGKKKRGKFSELIMLEDMQKVKVHACPSLQSLCVAIISEQVRNVSSLGGLSTKARNTICAIICKFRKLNPETAKIFYDVKQSDLSIYDCAYLDEAAFDLLPAFNRSLTELHLWQHNLTSLQNLTLSGAFLIKDQAWADLITGLPGLRSLKIEHSPRFNKLAITAIQNSNIDELTLHYCTRITTLPNRKFRYFSLEDSPLLKMATVKEQLGPHLKSLRLARFTGEIVRADLFQDSDLSKLSELYISECPDFDDDCVTALKNITGLIDLTLHRVNPLTSEPLIALVTPNSYLCNLNLNSSIEDHTLDELRLLLNGFSTLVYVDLSFARGTNNVLLEELVKRNSECKQLTVWGCQYVTSWWCEAMGVDGVDIGNGMRRYVKIRGAPDGS